MSTNLQQQMLIAEELCEISYIVTDMINDAADSGKFEETSKAVETYRVIGEIIKQEVIGDLQGGRRSREFSVGPRMKIQIIHT